MLASQLLRILQTLPNDVKQEDMRMKGNHDEGRDFPPFLDLNDGGDSSWNPFLADGQKGSRISGSPNGFSDELLVVVKDEKERGVRNGPGVSRDCDSNDDSRGLESDCDEKAVDDSVVHVLKDIRVVDDDGYVKDRVFVRSNERQVAVPDQVAGELSDDEGCSKTDPIEERGTTRCFLGSFLSSLDHEEAEAVPQHHHPIQISAEKENVIEEGVHDDEENSDVKKDKNDVGESSFSREEGLVSYSGPVTHGGSISMRSDGSATSGRSFAFPILHAEWNSSPVRMSKAEGGRHFRRFKGWKSGVFCCRF